jgi:hypothetical protein
MELHGGLLPPPEMMAVFLGTSRGNNDRRREFRQLLAVLTTMLGDEML